MKKSPLALIALLAGGVLFPVWVCADDPENRPPDVRQKSGPFIQGGYARQFDAGIGQGGEFSVDRAFIQGGYSFSGGKKARISVALGYGYDGYHFKGENGFAGLRPWSDVHSLRIGVPVRYQSDDQKWEFFGLPTLRFAAENGAGLEDGMFGGVLAGFSYRFSDRLTLGPGFGLFSKIDDGSEVFPILLIDWKISKRLSLTTGRGLAATAGPGLSLIWRANERWRYLIGARYEKLRFRLDDTGPAPGGTGEDRAFPLYVGALYAPDRKREVSFVAGSEFGGELRLDDANGNRVAESEQDDGAIFAGVTFRVRF